MCVCVLACAEKLNVDPAVYENNFFESQDMNLYAL